MIMLGSHIIEKTNTTMISLNYSHFQMTSILKKAEQK